MDQLLTLVVAFQIQNGFCGSYIHLKLIFMMQSSCNLNLPAMSSTSQNIKAYVLTISHSFDTDYFPCNMNSKHLFALASRLFGFCCKLCHCISHHYSITNQEDISKLVVLGIFNIEKNNASLLLLIVEHILCHMPLSV